ncbi:site-specific DNA-methyltransferase [Sharpea azabuensis]|uniref:site-specific DNA-methyltransferase n=1 Tax=Sharpea azabuensis TaxID=322505 RepID=UPI001567B9B8|nr:site-specific DNA-methyltransferase [Sharpea azabuensis]
MDKIEGLSLNLEKQNIDKLKELFPEAVEEGKVNFDILRAMLGDEVDDSREKYQFTWNGKAKSIKLAQTPSSATLRPCKEKSKNWDTTENLYIEGDNLEVLKQLQKTYYGKIKMIYIDPPYNTGNDFVYHDDFKNSLDNYKEQTNQTSSSNPESNGRFHTDWLNMMYPRLILAKNLLREDGVIFISIDDNEQDNLKKMMDEIYGESNFITTFIWEKRLNRENRKEVSVRHEYVICYCKNKTLSKRNLALLPMNEKALSNYGNPDNDPRGLWKSDPAHAQAGHGTKSQFYTLVAPNGKKHDLPSGRCWLYTKPVMDAAIKDNRIWFGKDGNGVPRIKTYLNAKDRGLTPETLLFAKDVSTNEKAKNDLKEMFNGVSVFDTPKPIELIMHLIGLGGSKDAIILDFFAGSNATAEAVIRMNSVDNGERKFVMIQLPELCDEKSEAYKAGYKNICEIGEERIRRAGKQIKVDWEKEHPKDTLLSGEEEFTTDIGFKVFKLDSSNVNEWDSSLELDEKELSARLGEVFKQDRSKEDILYEIMLKYGVFDRQVEEIEVNGKTMYRVGKRYMIVCLEDDLTSEDVKAIGELSPRTVIFKENGFADDNAKINAVYNLEHVGVEDLKCI